MGLHQVKSTPKFTLQLAYYLQLQDRIDAAYKIFSKIKEEDLEDNQKVLFHYMTAYFEFYKPEPDFEKIEGIIAQYRDYPIEHLTKMFKKIDQQLMEVKQIQAGNFDMDNENQAMNVQNANVKSKDNAQMIHEVTVNDQGDLIIE